MAPPKHIVSAAAIALNDHNEILLIKCYDKRIVVV